MIEPPRSVEVRAKLTSRQFQMLVRAAQRGYFKIPRETDLNELGADFDIHPQAVGPTLRRARYAVLNAYAEPFLAIDVLPDNEEPDDPLAEIAEGVGEVEERERRRVAKTIEGS